MSALIVGIALSGAQASAASLFSRVTDATSRGALARAQRSGAGVTFLQVDARAIAEFRSARGGELTVPTDAGELRLSLVPFDVLEGGAITVTDASGTHPIDADVTLFRGTVAGDPESWAVLALSPNGVMGTIETGGRRRVFGVADGARTGGMPLHVLSDEVAVAARGPGDWSCGVEGEAAEQALRDPARSGSPLLRGVPNQLDLNTNRLQFKIAIDCDYELYANKFGGNLTNATSYMLTLLGTVSLIYQRDIHCTLTYPYLNFWTIAADPWTGTDTSTQLPQFRTYWNANRTGVTRALAHLVSGRNLGGGIAYLDVLCGTSGYGVSAIDAVYSYPTNSTTWDVEVIAHELGHNFGSPHTHSCQWQSSGYVPAGALLDTCYAAEGGCNTSAAHVPPDKGTIMSYCHLLNGGIDNIRLDFHAACKTEMRLSAEAAGCQILLALQPPKLLVATNSPTGITLSWTAGTTSGVLGYDVYRSAYQLDPGITKRASTPLLSVPDTAFGTYYYRVRSIRAADSSEFSGELKATVCALQPPLAFPTADGPMALARADFNEDGIEDLAIPNYGAGNVSVLPGMGSAGVGNGSFAAPVSYATGQSPTCVVAGDWNADGIIDLAVGNYDGNSVRILLGQGSAGTGNGTFVAGSTVNSVSFPSDIARGDFNEDGISDLVVAGDYSAATILLGNGAQGIGDGTFVKDTVLAGGTEPKAVLVADFNQDGISDLATAHSGGARIFLGSGAGGRGDGNFTAGTDYTCGFSPASIASADFNADGITDLVLGNTGSNDISILLGLGAGGVGNGSFAPAVNYPSGNVPLAVRVADWSGDGIPDLLVANSTAAKTLSILVGGGALGVGTGGFGPPTTLPVTDQPRNTLLGDFNEDGAVDVAVVNRVASTLNILRASCVTPLPTALALTSPNGGEAWAEQQERVISWTEGAGVLAVNLEVSRDGGANWQPIAENVTGSSYVWTVTAPLTSNARVRVVDAVIRNRNDASDASFSVLPASSVGVPDAAPPAFTLSQAWPNPARHQLSVAFALPDQAPATLELLDLAGRRVSVRSVGHLGAGPHRVTLSPDRALAQGVYLLRLSRAGETRSIKVAFLD